MFVKETLVSFNVPQFIFQQFRGSQEGGENWWVEDIKISKLYSFVTYLPRALMFFP